MKFSAILFVAGALILTSCVSTKDGQKRFDPWEATLRADDSVGKTLQGMGYPASRRGDSAD